MGRLGRIALKMPQNGLNSGQPLAESGFRSASDEDRLCEVYQFGANPGNLRMLKYVPRGFARSAPLVVVLHGCTQTAASYDRGAGWTTLADEHGFALLFPEQKRENNAKSCFTFFDAGDTRRGAGEAASIRNMVERVIADHDIDAGRVFITGLSAGGAMTSVMLATYPEVFSAGAIIAGLPYRAADSVQEAFRSMWQGSSRTAEEWGALVRQASPHSGPWPRVSVWHGSADKTVAPVNAEESVKQWTDVHETMMKTERRNGVGYTKTVWRNEDGCEVVESVSLPGLAHGTPLAVTAANERCGEEGPFLIEAGVSSTHHIARFFGVSPTS
jgi:poly(hydroxyalkanoate) depolymerase family esterase